MAEITRSKRDDHLWFSDVSDSEDSVLSKLLSLDSEQAIELKIGTNSGIWIRFKGEPSKIPPALKRGNNDAKEIWKEVAIGSSTPLEVVRVLSIDESAGFATGRRKKVELAPVDSKIESDVLCIGVDVAWWGGGGSKSDRNSRMETIAFASRIAGEWGNLSLRRIDLNKTYNQDANEFTCNADPNADLLMEGILSVIGQNDKVDQVVIALDMPVSANDDGMKPPKKAYKEGEKGGEYRQCDIAWLRCKKSSQTGWRSVNIMTGAPIAPRIKALLSHLENANFDVFDTTSDVGNRIVFECFPNEILWSVGVLGLADGFTFKTLQLYKSIGKYKTPLPEEVFHNVWQLPITLALKLAGLPASAIDTWQEAFAEWLTRDGVFDASTKVGQTGKQFDDAIDSVLSLAAVVAFTEGRAHIHQGPDPKDGHIIGPGISNACPNV